MTKNGQGAKFGLADRQAHRLMVEEFPFSRLWSPSDALANATTSDGSATQLTRHPGPASRPKRGIAHRSFKARTGGGVEYSSPDMV